MKITDAITVSSEARWKRKCTTLITSIERRLQWHMKHSTSGINWSHTSKAKMAIAVLEAEKQRQKPLWEINSYISSRPILKLPAKELLEEIFKGLNKPGKAQHTALQRELLNYLTKKGQEGRAAQHSFKIACEVAEKSKHNWYMIFNTLTVDNGNYIKVFSKTSDAFKNYIKTVDRLFAIASYGSVRKAEGEHYHTYFACVEEGGQTGRLHIHVLHMFKETPKNWNDPNKGLQRPYRREINDLKKKWPYGMSRPIMVRSSPRDAWGRKGYRWPTDQQGNSLPIKSPLAFATYLSKYIIKGYKCQKRSKLLWRVRKSQQLGNKIIDEMMTMISTKNKLMIASLPNLQIKIGTIPIPPTTLRRAALKSYQNDLNTTNQSELATIADLANTAYIVPSPLQSLHGSTKITQVSNQLNSTLSQTVDFSDTDAYKKMKHELNHARIEIAKKYIQIHNTHLHGRYTSDNTHLQ